MMYLLFIAMSLTCTLGSVWIMKNMENDKGK
jgi:hypothetical protein